MEDNIEKLIQETFKLLSIGLMQPLHHKAYPAYKKLYEIGQPAVPVIKTKILETDWSRSKYKELSAYFSGLFSLLYDIDEDEAKSVGEKIIKNECPKHIKAIIQSTFAFSLKNYKRYQLRGVEVFEHKLIKSKCNIKSYLDEWLSNVPEGDLDEINRLYVINREKINASGTYTPILKIVALLWDNHYKEKSLSFKFFALITEQVLYHEIGHHVNRHDFGIDADQEREADKYAFQIIKKSHPYLVIFLKLLSKIGFKSKTNYYRWGCYTPYEPFEIKP
jgi:hypothetical protein